MYERLVQLGDSNTEAICVELSSLSSAALDDRQKKVNGHKKKKKHPHKKKPVRGGSNKKPTPSAPSHPAPAHPAPSPPAPAPAPVTRLRRPRWSRFRNQSVRACHTFCGEPHLVRRLHSCQRCTGRAGRAGLTSNSTPHRSRILVGMTFGSFTQNLGGTFLPRANIDEFSWDSMFATGCGTLALATWSQRQVFEAMVDFWSNHLNVTCPSDGVWDNRADYDPHGDPSVRAWQVLRHAHRECGSSRDAQLPQQQHEHQDPAERELRPRVAGAPHPGRRCGLYRGRGAVQRSIMTDGVRTREV